MNRTYTAIIVGLFAIAALEFGLLGASAAGMRGGGSADLPPIVQRGAVTPTDTPTVMPVATATPLAFKTVTPVPQLSPPLADVDITGAFLQAEPLTIRCDGSQGTSVKVRLLKPNGDPVPDETLVFPSTYNGNAAPYLAYTQDGYATFSVRFYGDIFPSGPNFIVRSGLLEAGIRIRCNPNSNGGCAISPPSLSPPCATPTPRPNCSGSPPQASPPCPGQPTPYPCNPSLGSGPISPPCPVKPTPYPCNPSPGSGPISPPCPGEPTPYPCSPSPGSGALSPPCATPSACGYAPYCPYGFAVAIDCNLNISGVQDQCSTSGPTHDVGVVLRNNSGVDSTVAAFNFFLHVPDTSLLSPPVVVGGILDDNPDFNQDALGKGFECQPDPGDNGASGPGAAKLLMSCYFRFEGGSIPSIANGAEILLATVHFNVPTGAVGSSSLYLSFVNVFDEFVQEVASCEDIITTPANCYGATVTVERAGATPTHAATRTVRPTHTPTIVRRIATPSPKTATSVPRTATRVVRTFTPRPQGRCADFNGDGKVTIRDAKLVAGAVLRHNNDRSFDINGDGRVSQRDAVLAFRQIGRRC